MPTSEYYFLNRQTDIPFYTEKYAHACIEWKRYLCEEDAFKVAREQVDIFDLRGRDIRDYDLIEQINLGHAGNSPYKFEQQIVWIKRRNKG